MPFCINFSPINHLQNSKTKYGYFIHNPFKRHIIRSLINIQCIHFPTESQRNISAAGSCSLGALKDVFFIQHLHALIFSLKEDNVRCYSRHGIIVTPSQNFHFCFFFCCCRKKTLKMEKWKRGPFIMHKCVRIRSSRRISMEIVKFTYQMALGMFWYVHKMDAICSYMCTPYTRKKKKMYIMWS